MCRAGACRGRSSSPGGTVTSDQVLESLRSTSCCITISANPATSQIRIRFTGLNNNTYRLVLRNAMGQLVESKFFNITRYGQTEYLMRPVCMAPGTYFILVYEKNNKLLSSDRVIVQ